MWLCWRVAANHNYTARSKLCTAVLNAASGINGKLNNKIRCKVSLLWSRRSTATRLSSRKHKTVDSLKTKIWQKLFCIWKHPLVSEKNIVASVYFRCQAHPALHAKQVRGGKSYMTVCIVDQPIFYGIQVIHKKLIHSLGKSIVWSIFCLLTSTSSMFVWTILGRMITYFVNLASVSNIFNNVTVYLTLFAYPQFTAREWNNRLCHRCCQTSHC